MIHFTSHGGKHVVTHNGLKYTFNSLNDAWYKIFTFIANDAARRKERTP